MISCTRVDFHLARFSSIDIISLMTVNRWIDGQMIISSIPSKMTTRKRNAYKNRGQLVNFFFWYTKMKEKSNGRKLVMCIVGDDIVDYINCSAGSWIWWELKRLKWQTTTVIKHNKMRWLNGRLNFFKKQLVQHNSLTYCFNWNSAVAINIAWTWTKLYEQHPRDAWYAKYAVTRRFIQSRNAENYSFIIVSICQHKLLFERDRWMKMARKFSVNRNENGRQSFRTSFAYHIINTWKKANIATPFPIECCLAKPIFEKS